MIPPPKVLQGPRSLQGSWAGLLLMAPQTFPNRSLGQLTCAETFVPSLPLLLNCNGPEHFHVGGSDGM